MTDHTSPWTTLAQEHHYEDRYFRVDVDRVRHRTSGDHPHTAVRFKVHGIAVVPVDHEGCVHLIGQYRYVLERFTWETVRGSGPLTDTPLATAQRELSEETGFTAGSWLQLFTLDASPGITSEQAPCFVAWQLQQRTDHPDPAESLNRRRLPFRQAVEAALSGEITDAATVAALLAMSERARSETLPADLLALLGPR